MTAALLIIDIQNDYFPGGKWTLDGADQAANNAARLLAQASLQVFPAGSSVGRVLMSLQSLCTKQHSMNLHDKAVSHHVRGIAA